MECISRFFYYVLKSAILYSYSITLFLLFNNNSIIF
nr:MAG TPA: hypothetical protein [Caudoviricetes sp.]